MRKILIVGAGHFGYTLATELAERGPEVVVIDNDPNRAEEIKSKVTQVVVADGTSKEVLARFGHDADVAVVAMGERIDASILATHFLKEIGVKRLISKATSVDHGRVLKLVGATQVVFPERDEAIRLATSLVTPNLLEFMQLSDDFNIVEVAVPNDFINKSIEQLDLRKEYGLQILAVQNPLDGKINVLPAPTYAFKPDDVMIVIGDKDALQKIQDS